MCIYVLVGTTQVGQPRWFDQPPWVLKYFVPIAVWNIVRVYLARSAAGLVCDAQLYWDTIIIRSCAPFTLCDE